VFSYSVGGFFAGLLHHVLVLPFGEGYGHRLLQVISALVMAGAGCYIAGWFPHFAYIEKLGRQFWHGIEPHGRRLLPVKTLRQAFAFGMVWGWLPCGLVYAALALAATAGDVGRSTLTMFAFGVGTLPAVVSVGVMTSLLVRLSRMNRFRQFTGVTLIVIALLAAFPWLNPMVLHSIH
jgi:sulfite exporter TauE/SafE